MERNLHADMKQVSYIMVTGPICEAHQNPWGLQANNVEKSIIHAAAIHKQFATLMNKQCLQQSLGKLKGHAYTTFSFGSIQHIILKLV